MTATATKPAPRTADFLGAEIRARLTEKTADAADAVFRLARRVVDGERLDAEQAATILRASDADPDALDAAIALIKDRRRLAAMVASAPNWDLMTALRERDREAAKTFEQAGRDFHKATEEIKQARNRFESSAAGAIRARQQLIDGCPDVRLLSREKALQSRRREISKRAEHLRVQAGEPKEIFLTGSGHPESRGTVFGDLEALKSKRNSVAQGYAPDKPYELKRLDSEILETEAAISEMTAERLKLMEQLAAIDVEQREISNLKLQP